MLNKRRKEKPDEVFVHDGCQVRVYLAPKVRRALRKAAWNRRPLWNL